MGNIKIKIDQYCRTVPNYPVEGVNFYDLNSLFSSPVWHEVVVQSAHGCGEGFLFPTHIVGIESRGFVLGAALAHEMKLPFTMIRKKGAKYPGKLLEESYELEYGVDTLTLQEGILGHTARVIIADDLIATGGSMIATKRLIEQTGAKVLGGVSIVNLEYLNRAEIHKQQFWTVNSLEVKK
jgi:adenine phosphoribosyltransferase|tara:strand:+ start:73 stop:615 length:543 start_codon:yes stop_codon:yes gene_type:complete